MSVVLETFKIESEQWKKTGEQEATVRTTYPAAMSSRTRWHCSVYHHGSRRRGQATPTNQTVFKLVLYVLLVIFCPDEDCSKAVETVGKNIKNFILPVLVQQERIYYVYEYLHIPNQEPRQLNSFSHKQNNYVIGRLHISFSYATIIITKC